MYNISELLTSIKMDLGLLGMRLPITDEEILAMIKLKTIKIFSVHFPRIVNFELDLKFSKCLKRSYKETHVELPDVFGEYRIVGVKKVDVANQYYNASYCDYPNISSGYSIYGDAMMGQVEADLDSMLVPSFSFKFRDPNILILFNCDGNNKLNLEVGLEHFSNLSSIPYTMFDNFYELALLDVKRFLYNILKHYDNIESAFGTVNLRIDDWSNAEGDRKDLLAKWGSLYHLEADQVVII